MRIVRRYLEGGFSERTPGRRIEWIVVHYTGTPSAQGSAAKIAKILAGSTAGQRGLGGKKTSTHYLVGDDGVIQLVRDRHRAWHVGGYKPSNRLTAENDSSLGVDLVEHKISRGSGGVGDRDWFFSEKVVQTGAELVAMLADRYGIADDHIVRHYDVTGKRCPRPFVGADVSEYTRRPHEEAWADFKRMVAGYRRGSQREEQP